MLMRREFQLAVVGALALALSSCMTPPTQFNASGSGASTLGTADSGQGYGSGTYRPPPASTTPPPPLKDASVDKSQSSALTDYLKSHRLPLVGARVLVSPSGQRQLMLYGFVASEYGKDDAEAKARKYLNDPGIGVDNQIKVQPQLANSTSNPSAASTYDPSMGGVQAYENQQAQDAYQQSQISQYQAQNQGPSALTTLIPLLGIFGGSFGSGGFSGGMGGFGGGYAPYGGGPYGGGPYGGAPYGGAYGYPAPPPPGFGYGPPMAPWP
jgi:hypothetical protein